MDASGLSVKKFQAILIGPVLQHANAPKIKTK